MNNERCNKLQDHDKQRFNKLFLDPSSIDKELEYILYFYF